MNSAFVYVACPGEGTLDVFRLDPAGKLTLVARVPGLDEVRALALNRRDGLLYSVHNTAGPQLRVFRIDGSTGLPTLIGATALPESAAHLSLAAGDTRLLAASYFGGVVTTAAVMPDGGPSDTATVACAPGPHTHCAVPSPDGRFVYAAVLGADKLRWYTLGPDGEMKEAGSVDTEAGSGPRHLIFSASGTRLYVLHELTGTVGVYGREPDTGALERLQSMETVPVGLGLVRGAIRTPDGPPVPADSIWCAELKLGANGRFLFTTDRGSSTVTSLAVDPGTGLLAFLRNEPTEAQPRGAAVDPDGRFLLVCGERSDAVTVYSIDPDDGRLTATDRAATGRGPLWIETYRP